MAIELNVHLETSDNEYYNYFVFNGFFPTER